MIKQGILNADLRSLTARIGHRDRFAIVDAGYNIPLGIETVDLAFLPNIPSMFCLLHIRRSAALTGQSAIVLQKIPIAFRIQQS